MVRPSPSFAARLADMRRTMRRKRAARGQDEVRPANAERWWEQDRDSGEPCGGAAGERYRAHHHERDALEQQERLWRLLIEQELCARATAAASERQRRECQWAAHEMRRAEERAREAEAAQRQLEARAAADQQRARERAQLAANAEAAAAYHDRACAALERGATADAQRLLAKAASLQPSCRRYAAELRALRRAVFWSAVSRRADAICAAARAHAVVLALVLSAVATLCCAQLMPRVFLAPHRANARRTRVAPWVGRCTLVFACTLALALRLLLPRARWRRLSDPRAALRLARPLINRAAGAAAAAAAWLERIATGLLSGLGKLLEALFEDGEAESTRRRQERQEQWAQAEYERRRRRQSWEEQYANGRDGRSGRAPRQHARQGGAHERRAPPQAQPRRAPSSEDTLRQRARQLPPGDVREALVASTHYAALGVGADASEAELKRAFHRRALKLHPDKNKEPLAEEAFKRVQDAHATLCDRAARRAYDLSLPDALWRHGGERRADASHGASRRRQPQSSYTYHRSGYSG